MFCLVNVIARLCKCVSYSTLAIHVEDLMTEDSCFLQHVACLFFPDVCECACLIKHRKRHVEDLMTEDSEMEDTEPSDEEEEEEEVCV